MENQIKKCVLRIKAGSSNVYLIKNGKNSVLVDSGNRRKGTKILRELNKNGVNASDISLIVVTHCHYDHVGSLRYLKEKTGAKILVHENEAVSLKKGYLELPDGTNRIFKFIVWIGRTLLPFIGKYEPVTPDIIVNKRFDSDFEGLNLYILPTPGHTSGSISLILDDTLAFVGDTAFNVMNSDVFPPFANDIDALLESWEVLLQTKVRYFYPGHGKPFTKEKLTRNYEKHK
jgi:glyoxylase-like metal-dependent hydrolase (beta-lactamase superfamily II)